ncbi:MAG: zinc ribbon domain-containing protein, partial [Desulfobacterales bacterium]|nr:zinc ribbon domain-containing protein [Desulfobacterales bacterium]
MQCPNCQTENPVSRKFCRECGGKLVPVCPACGCENTPGDKFCGECGHALIAS